MSLGLYVHVPFCAAICNYCNFNRGLLDEPLKQRYLEALLAEIAHAPHIEADTLFFGGGTPSLLSPPEIARIVAACRSTFAVADDAEITLEANPESVDGPRLEGIRQAGVNRLSFGVQSFRDDELRRLERAHSAARAVEVVELARAAGFDNVSVDLMMWLPEQGADQWMESVERTIAVNPDHVSLYMLEVYPHLTLKQQMVRHDWSQLGDDVAAEMYERGMARLEEAGYEQYEISNAAKLGRRSRHNLKYWSDGEWLGFGPGAHSTRGGSRWRNVSSTADYVQRLSNDETVVVDRTDLSNRERLGDAMFMGLRLNEGIDLSALSRRYATDVWGDHEARLAPYVTDGVLVKEGDRLRLTRQGMLIANEVMQVFV